MAGDWIKVHHGLIDKPEVMQLAETLNLSPFAVVGHLLQFWFWVDQNFSESCPQVKGTRAGIDRVCGVDGFAAALEDVGWLAVDGNLFSIPGYDSHLSTSAKNRATDAKKKQEQRRKSKAANGSGCPDSVSVETGQNRGPEKRRGREEDFTHTHTVERKPDEVQPEAEELWLKFLQMQFNKQGQHVDDIQREAMAMEVRRRGAAAVVDLEFSIQKGAKTLLRASDDFAKLRAEAERSRVQGKPNVMGETKGQQNLRKVGF